MSGLGISSISSFIAALHLCSFLTQCRLKTLPTIQKNHQMAKKLPWTRMGTLTRLLACGTFEGGRRKEAGLRWPDIALSDQTGSPLAVRVRILGSTSDSKPKAISTFGQRFRNKFNSHLHVWPTNQKAFMGRLRNVCPLSYHWHRNGHHSWD